MRGAIDRFLEAVRARVWETSTPLVGQVVCSSKYHWLLDSPGMKCSRCGAQV